MQDRQTIGIDRTSGLFRDIIIHHSQKPGRQEKAHGIMAVPPLDQRRLNPAPNVSRMHRSRRPRNSGPVHQMQNGDRQDEGQEKPVGDIDVLFFAQHQSAKEVNQIYHPNNGQPKIGIPFRLSIFEPLGDTRQIAEASHKNEGLIAPEMNPGELVGKQSRPTGSLNDMIRGREQDIAAKGKNHR